jgi:hypothetical protein
MAMRSNVSDGGAAGAALAPRFLLAPPLLPPPRACDFGLAAACALVDQ